MTAAAATVSPAAAMTADANDAETAKSRPERRAQTGERIDTTARTRRTGAGAGIEAATTGDIDTADIASARAVIAVDHAHHPHRSRHQCHHLHAIATHTSPHCRHHHRPRTNLSRWLLLQLTSSRNRQQ